MIKSWTIENFKSVADSMTLDFAPLTIFAGANSSGKSTIIQSILLITQTLQSDVDSRCVVLNGKIVRLGVFRDILFNGASRPRIEIGFDIIPISQNFYPSRRNIQKYAYLPDPFINHVDHIHCCFSFSAQVPDGKEKHQLHPQLEHTEVNVVYKPDEKKSRLPEEFRVERRTDSIENIFSAEGLEPPTDKTEILLWFNNLVTKPRTYTPPTYLQSGVSSGKPIACHLQHFLPKFLAYVYQEAEAKANGAIDALDPSKGGYRNSSLTSNGLEVVASNSRVRNLILDLVTAVSSELPHHRQAAAMQCIALLQKDFSHDNWRNLIGRIGIDGRRRLAQRLSENELLQEVRSIFEEEIGKKKVLGYGPVPPNFDQSVGFIDVYFSAYVKYLGPLRDEPKPIYPHGGSVDTADVGYKGEFTAAVLEMHKETEIRYVPTSEFIRVAGSSQEISAPLSVAVLDWLQYMGVADQVETSDKGKLGHDLKISPVGGSDLHDLTHVGVGVSQVLPILVQSLLAEKGATLIFEQPELHLHPRVQTRLADFFVSLSLHEKRCIIETHSEYLINRLRFLSVKSEDDSVSKLSKIYFVEKKAGASVYRPMVINEFGVITNWPKGFFDEGEELASETIKASMLKKQKRAREVDSERTKASD